MLQYLQTVTGPILIFNDEGVHLISVSEPISTVRSTLAVPRSNSAGDWLSPGMQEKHQVTPRERAHHECVKCYLLLKKDFVKIGMSKSVQETVLKSRYRYDYIKNNRGISGTNLAYFNNCIKVFFVCLFVFFSIRCILV